MLLALVAACSGLVANPARASDASLRASVAAGFAAVRDGIDGVESCQCLEAGASLKRVSIRYRDKVNRTVASTSRGGRARAAAFYAFDDFRLYGTAMALAALQAGTSYEPIYRKIALVRLRQARVYARRAQSLLGLSSHP